MMEPSELLRLSEMDPELEEFLNTHSPPDPTRSIETLRTVYQTVETAILTMIGTDSAVVETEVAIPVRDGSHISAQVHKPSRPPSNGSPLIVLFHPGGYCMGSSSGMVPMCRAFVKRFGAVCLNVDYRLAPEHPFPTPVNDAWDTLQWAAANATTILGANPSQGFVVGGENSGGSISAVLAHLARDSTLSPPLTGQYLSAPSLLPPDVVPERYRSQYLSWEQNKDSIISNRTSLQIVNAAYRGDSHSPLFAPFNHPNGHGGLPRTYFQICGMDPVRDEGLIYEKVLKEDYGVPTRLDVYPGQPHGFWNFFPRFRSTRKAKDDVMKGMAWLLER